MSCRVRRSDVPGLGAKICTFSQHRTEEQTGPVILLVHSLGSIASVDLLLLTDLPHVRAHVTVGSQAPYLYEVSALTGLEQGPSGPRGFRSG
jgi:predicted alpha/beta hydrolase family esterase